MQASAQRVAYNLHCYLSQARTRQRQQAAQVEEASDEVSPMHPARQSPPQAPHSTSFMDAVASDWGLAPGAVRTAERMLERPRWQGSFSLLDVWEDSQSKFAEYQSWQRESPRAQALWPRPAASSGRTTAHQSTERPFSSRTVRARAHWQQPRPSSLAESMRSEKVLQHPSLLRAHRMLDDYQQRRH